MNFNSIQFAVFLIVVLVLYGFVVDKTRLRNLFLLGASYFFYMSWNWKYAGLIAFSTVVDYLVGLRLAQEDRPSRRKALLVTSLVVNLGLLFVFKYFNFFVDSASDLFSLFGREIPAVHLRLLLPVGISFYTFQTLSYSIDLYRREIAVEKSLLRFAVFVSFFPQLVAGPIVRASDFLPQLDRTPNVNRERFRSGMLLMFRGLFKKIIIADLLAGLGVDSVFADPAHYSSIDLIFALYGYSFQIYNDFSGYSDIAIGVARMLGFDLTMNFNRPYLSRNVREFWTRWHISLSSWLRDYLYIPLGGNRSKPLRARFNLLATMVLGGLWHGAALNFVLWGLWHGLLLVLARGTSKSSGPVSRWLVFWQRFTCFHVVVISWLLFRIGGLGDLLLYIRGLVAFEGGTKLSPLYFVILGVAALSHFISQDLLSNLSERFIRVPIVAQAGVYAALLLLFLSAGMGAPSFIYFQF